MLSPLVVCLLACMHGGVMHKCRCIDLDLFSIICIMQVYLVHGNGTIRYRYV